MAKLNVIPLDPLAEEGLIRGPANLGPRDVLLLGRVPWGQRCSGCNSCGLPPGHQTGVPQGPWWDQLPDAGSWWPSSVGRPGGQSCPGSAARTALLSHNSITQPPFCTSNLGVSVKALHPSAPMDGLTLPPEPSGQDHTAGRLSGVTSE